MRSPRYTKQLLYNEIESFRQFAGIRNSDSPIDAIKLAKSGGLSVDFCPFRTKGLRGTLVIEENNGHIILDEKEGSFEKNFFCGHELIHFLLHKDIGNTSFQCFDHVKHQQNSILEWHANEGAAQLIVPYQNFIPRFIECLSKKQQYLWTQGYLSDYYHVTPQVINNRLDSLSYEIDQYRRGVSIDQLEILSRNQRTQRGIKTTYYGAMCAFPLEWKDAIG